MSSAVAVRDFVAVADALFGWEETAMVNADPEMRAAILAPWDPAD